MSLITRNDIIFRVLLCIIVVTIIAGCSSGGGTGFDPSSSATISLAWDAPTSYSDGSGLDPATGIKEYRIYYRTETGSYSAGNFYSVSAPATSVTVSNLSLPSGTYYFVITAVDQTDMESDFSNEVSRTIN